MIKSIIPLLYHTRSGEKRAIIVVAVNSWQLKENGITYTITDYKIENGSREWISEKELTYSWDQLNSLNDYLDLQYDYTGLSKKEVEFLKAKHALLLETQTNPIYLSKASDWVLSEENN